ncbi:MAG: ureidoglycolate lyase [Pseudomonadota bacterium]
MTSEITAVPLTSEAFAPFGDVIDMRGAPSFQFNSGMCDRYHDLARLHVAGTDARLNISLARARPYALPVSVPMVERHPFGSQAFIPLGPQPFLVFVAADTDGRPDEPLAFLTEPGQGVNYLPNVWHGVLTPLLDVSNFAVIDREGPGDNLEIYTFETPYRIVTDAA